MRRVYDEGAVQPRVDVALERGSVTVIEVAAEEVGIELVDELLAGLDLAVSSRPRAERCLVKAICRDPNNVPILWTVEVLPLGCSGRQQRARDCRCHTVS